VSEHKHHTITDGPYTENIEVEWTGDEFVSLTQVMDKKTSQSSTATVHVSMGQLHALGLEATKRLALRHLPPDAVPHPVEEELLQHPSYSDATLG